MPDVKLTAVDRVGMAVQGAAREQPRRQPRGGYPRPKPPGSRLITATVPGADPERYEVLYMLAEDGSLAEIRIREIDSGTEVARLLPRDIERLFQEADPGGLLFESRG